MRHASLIPVLVASLLASTAFANEGFEVWHSVQKGDTLGALAKRYEVKPRDIKRWNRIRGTRLKPGHKLHIWSQVAIRPTRIIEHTLRRGDTLTRLSKQYRTSPEKLKRLNGWRRRPRLVVGNVVKVEVQGPENPSVTRGAPQSGRLVNGEKLPDGPGYQVRVQGNAYGTNDTVTLLMTCLPKVKKKWKNAPEILVGDLSREHGGRFPPHRSHQNGLDVDISYFHNVRPAPDYFREATPGTLDAEKTWFLLKTFIDTGRVDYIFVDYSLQKALYDEAKKRGAKAKQLDQWFQYPNGKGMGEGLIRHSPSHKNHFHIRFIHDQDAAS